MILNKQDLDELKKCLKDKIYAINTYFFIKDPIKGKIPFKLFDYQIDLIHKFDKFRFNIIYKPRQMGLSWLVAAYVLCKANFNFNQIIEMISIKEEAAVDLLNKIKFIYGNLPQFLRAVQNSNQTEINYSIKDKNGSEHGMGSMIRSLTSSETAGRGGALSLLILDEAGFIRWADTIWSSAYPTLSTGGSCIILSTANGVGGVGEFFFKMWNDAIQGKNEFETTELFWDQFPGRDEKWYAIQKKNMSSLQFAQEVEKDFIQSGMPVFKQAYLKIRCEHQKPDKNKVYLIGCDPAEGGLNNDNSAIDIIDYETGDEVFSKKYNCPPDVFAKKIDKVVRKYRGIVGIERNNHGHTVIAKCKDLGTPGLYIHDDKKYGWLTTKKTKPEMIDELEIAIREEKTKIGCQENIDELKLYQYKEDGSTGAQEGFNDDKVIAKAIAWKMRKSRYVFNIEKIKQLEELYARPPLKRGDLIIEERQKGKFLFLQQNKDGNLKLWDYPVKKGQYAIGVVPCIMDDDIQNENVCVVLDRSSYNIIAIYSKACDYDQFANDIRKIGVFFNTAMIGLDDNLHTETLKTVLDDCNYPNVYEELFKSEIHKKKQRIMFIDLLRALLRKQMIDIPDTEIIRELYSYTETAGEVDTTPGLFNQKTLATAIGAQIVKDNFQFPDTDDEDPRDEDGDE